MTTHIIKGQWYTSDGHRIDTARDNLLVELRDGKLWDPDFATFGEAITVEGDTLRLWGDYFVAEPGELTRIGYRLPVGPPDLADAGQAMFGSQWQSELARYLNVSDRTLRRWAAGDVTLPANLRAELTTLIDDRIRNLEAAKTRLAKAS